MCWHFRHGITGTFMPAPVTDQSIEPLGAFSESMTCSATESSQFNGRKKATVFYFWFLCLSTLFPVLLWKKLLVRKGIQYKITYRFCTREKTLIFFPGNNQAFCGKKFWKHIKHTFLQKMWVFSEEMKDFSEETETEIVFYPKIRHHYESKNK